MYKFATSATSATFYTQEIDFGSVFNYKGCRGAKDVEVANWQRPR